MTSPARFLTVGQLATRSGVQTSALRFYESQGLISSRRTEGNQRRYARETLRRVAFIRAARVIGLSLREIVSALGELPEERTPDRDDWAQLSSAWRSVLDDRISELERLRDNLNGCIGCGCLSLESCALFNTDDVLAARGPGARRLLEEAPGD
ncbi:MAG: redox-sensitive transcriptional activator SoxR [Chloroflexi bacterium]|nr:redox-sensitive transcriptional activator SoxR [Chloroflexota bacterium]MCH8234705.1 redox-sensitive transcriptional activator SoxR [Chloroflexota bacterium]MCH8816998.1 redox-sensitive transcriptional activator SoxR [Chloroflexota bacterium]